MANEKPQDFHFETEEAREQFISYLENHNTEKNLKVKRIEEIDTTLNIWAKVKFELPTPSKITVLYLYNFGTETKRKDAFYFFKNMSTQDKISHIKKILPTYDAPTQAHIPTQVISVFYQPIHNASLKNF